jgi:predicted RNA-binding protein YlqC (UPF0109 family)
MKKEFQAEASEMLHAIATALVDDTNAVDVNVTNNNNVYLFSLSAKKEDTGKLIGREGRTATMIRNLLNAVASKHGVRAILDIAE